jgi:2-keto-4-pentenoate hydratase/2-oxohepta-3-ene-1,7-dioic acid hydratase in catechol pathway
MTLVRLGSRSLDTLANVRIARFTTGDEPRFGVVGQDESGQDIVAIMHGDPLYRSIQLTGEKVPLADVRLLAPVIPRSKVVGISRNYLDYAAELGKPIPDEPLIFIKPNTSVIGPDEPIVLPPQASEVHHEAELAIVIGRIAKAVPNERAAEVILGYTCANDVTARDLQRRDFQQPTRAKGFDTFCPLGPWIETDLDPRDLAVRCRVNETQRQLGRTSQMRFDVPSIVSFVSQTFTLLPGDVILTGTPSGVGEIVAGDQVTVSVENIGVLSNPVVPPD